MASIVCKMRPLPQRSTVHVYCCHHTRHNNSAKRVFFFISLLGRLNHKCCWSLAVGSFMADRGGFRDNPYAWNKHKIKVSAFSHSCRYSTICSFVVAGKIVVIASTCFQHACNQHIHDLMNIATCELSPFHRRHRKLSSQASRTPRISRTISNGKASRRSTYLTGCSDTDWCGLGLLGRSGLLG